MTHIFIGPGYHGDDVALALKYANRHGLITGSTGSGKTTTLQLLAEGFSSAGVPVFAADVKGDLSGLAAPGNPVSPAARRAQEMRMPYSANAFPVRFWDVRRDQGLPVQTSLHRIGPQLVARMLNLNQTQEGALAIAFKWSEDEEAPLFDLEDLRWTLSEMLERREEISGRYGNITAASVNTIQREILAAETQGANDLFGEPAFEIGDLLQNGFDGRGVINLLHADSLMEAPRLYSSLLLWMLTELFRELPEAGDLDKPKLVFFFDEAHLLFADAPKKLLETIERVVRLVRSKGVAVFFVTQTAQDIPASVLAQLGNRVQHSLRAYTPAERKKVRAAAQAFRPNPMIDTEATITAMGTGEALVSCLGDDGVPAMVDRVKILPPSSKLGPILADERRGIMIEDPLAERFPAVRDATREQVEFNQRWRREKGLDIHDQPLTSDGVDVVGDAMKVLREGTAKPASVSKKWLVLTAVAAGVLVGMFVTS